LDVEGRSGRAGRAVGGLIETSRVRAAVARQEGNGTTLIVGLDGTPSDLDPHSQYDYRSTMVVRSIYEGLVGLVGSATDEFEGLVAESWEANEDQSVWTFKIRPGLTFQDGSACDSAAVKASYERLLGMNRGAVAVFSRFISDPTQMSTPDAGTIVFDCGTPQPLFLTAMAATYGPQIVNAAVAMEHEEDGDFGNTWLQVNAEGTGTGGWKLVSFEPGEQVILERNENYWRGWEGNHFERIIIRVVEEVSTMRQLVESGDVDIIDRFSVSYDEIDALMQVPTLTVDISDSTEVEYLTMTEAGPLASPEARQAMCYAFPYQDVIDGVYSGYASRANSLVAPSVLGYQQDGFFFETDLEKAKELLTTAGIPEGTELTLLQSTGTNPVIAELFQANLAEIGIALVIEPVDQGTRAATFYGDTPAEERPNFMVWSWWPDYNDAWNVLYPTTSCDAWGSKGANGGFYCNEEVDALLAEAKDASTLKSYTKILGDVQSIITERDVPVISSSQPKWPTVLQSNIEGFACNPINLGTYDFWTLSRKA
ncbi:MAG TPA: ABC transporter substrate-binding protein, partial [Thermomicrobiales bacterium]|nr:ABC transporter substrate-binding protein [Thermomicrobiales bacterium]